jgi:16S rRNA (uracil1498-N3)-methyltransferase
MHRFYLPPDQCQSNRLVLTGSEAHHALHVLRLKRGDPVVVLDGAGTEYHGEIAGSGRDDVQLSVTRKHSVAPLPAPITLLQAVPRGKIIEDIIQKATELGVARVVPLLTERVATRLDGAGAAQKADKWQAVAIEAIKQCGAVWLPKVEAPIALPAFLTRKESFDLALVASLQPGSRHPGECLARYRPSEPPRSVCVWIGPEGDFTPEEIRAIEASGAFAITLGRQVLRTGTAAIYCLSILNYEFSRRD